MQLPVCPLANARHHTLLHSACLPPCRVCPLACTMPPPVCPPPPPHPLPPAAIEGRNNQLELHSRNNQKLLTALEGLMDRLTLPEGAERALQARDITSSK